MRPAVFFGTSVPSNFPPKGHSEALSSQKRPIGTPKRTWSSHLEREEIITPTGFCYIATMQHVTSRLLLFCIYSPVT